MALLYSISNYIGYFLILLIFQIVAIIIEKTRWMDCLM